MSESQLQALLQAIKTLQDLGKVAYFNKGMYNSETNYEINDVVSYNGSSYVSLLNNNQGNLPTNATYWSVVALKGDKGDTGKPFVIEKTYESIEDMVADYDNMQVNDYVMIQGNIEEEENATLWTKTETEVSPYKWVYLADFSGASGITGATPNIQIGTVTEGNEPSVTRRAGSSNENPILDFVLKTGATGATGATGNGISSISKTSTSGLTDIYTIEYTNSNSTTYNVTNGKGIASIVKTGTSGLVDTYTITYNDGTTSTYTITNGEDGEVTQEQLDETNSEIELVRKIYNAFPTTSSENESITLNGTAEVNFKKFELKGNTSQYTTTGKNLFDKDNPNIITNKYLDDSGNEINGNSFSISDYIRVEPNTIYSNQPYESKSACICFYNSSKTFLSSVRLTAVNPNFTTPNNCVYIRISLVKADINNIQIEKGSTASNYEPFTGNQPSPNPDYPQNIEVVTGNNTILVEGKNKFNINDAYYKRLDTGTVTINSNNIIVENASTTAHQFVWWNIPIMVGEEITISYNSLTESTSDNNNGINYMFSDEPYTSFVSFDNFSKVDKTNKYSTTTATKKYLVIGLRVIPSCTNTCNKLQIEKGQIASEYKEFQGRQIHTINLGSIELCKIGDYQDYIYKSNNKWYKYGAIGKIVLDGSETNWSVVGTGTSNYFYNIGFSPFIKTGGLSALSTYYPYTQVYTSNTNQGFYISATESASQIRIRYGTEQSLNDFKNWLSNNNVSIYYVLATPTTTEITDSTLIEQLNNIENAYSYDTQTNISQINADKPFIINAEAIMSLKNIFNS